MEECLQVLDELLAASSHALAFTGAGVSEESGVPTFRGSGGLWEDYPPAVYGNLAGLAAAFFLRARRLAGFAADMATALWGASPNPCHVALAEMERRGLLEAVITQNVDDLHAMAGSGKVLELHGNAYRLRCLRCRRVCRVGRERLAEVAARLRAPRVTRRDLVAAFRHYAPRCTECGARTRPDVVFFGEGLPPRVLDESIELAARCDLLLVLGTASVVYPAALVPRVAMEAGAVLVEVNPHPTPLTPHVRVRIPHRAGAFFARYLESHAWG